MKNLYLIAIIIAILGFGISGELKAEEINCKIGQQSCGTNCCWRVEGTILKITGGADGSIGIMNDYDEVNGTYSQPWKQEFFDKIDISGISYIGDNSFREIPNLKSLNIDSQAKTIGRMAFFRTSLENAEISNDIKYIREGAFAATKISSFTIPDSLNYIGQQSFHYNENMQEIIISDTITQEQVSEWIGSAFLTLNPIKIKCKGALEVCKKALSKYLPNEDFAEGTCEKYCFSGENFETANESQCIGENYYWSGTSCNNKKNGIKCALNWKRNEDFCNRIRYTPAEAAQWLKDDDNTVVLTFKK